MIDAPHASPLGDQSEYPQHYDADLLFPIARAKSRKLLGIEHTLPFSGVDIWTAYELSWLNEKGKPEVAVGEFILPCESSVLIESKSLKLYLNSINQRCFSSFHEVARLLEQDLSKVAETNVAVQLWALNSIPRIEKSAKRYRCLDDLDADCHNLVYDPQLIRVSGDEAADQSYCSHLMKSNCPVTGQPDWASVYIDCSGPLIAPDALLRYLVSFRQHQEFHEQCVERIFIDLEHAGMTALTVQARYLRRGGIDINPVRSNVHNYPIIGRTARQ